MDEKLLKGMEDIKSPRPFWGYRRATCFSKCRRNMSVGYKKICRAVKENKLTVAQGTGRGISTE